MTGNEALCIEFNRALSGFAGPILAFLPLCYRTKTVDTYRAHDIMSTGWLIWDGPVQVPVSVHTSKDLQ